MRKIGLFALCFLSCVFGGVVSTLMSVYLPVAVKDLLGEVSGQRMLSIGAAINSSFIFGWTVGGLAWGLVCDRIGRSKSVMLATLCYGAFMIATSFASSWMLVTTCRFLTGFGVGGVLVTTNILVGETWTGKKRAVALGILSMSIPIGIFSAGLVSHFLPGWRQAFLVGIGPLALAGLSPIVLKESTQWKAATERRDPKGFLATEYHADLLRGSVIFGAMLIGMWAIFSWLPTWVQSLSDGQDAQQERGLSMMVMGAGGLAGSFISGWVVHAAGVRRTMMSCFIICFGMTFLLFKTNHVFGGVARAEEAVLAIFFGMSQGALSAYIPELFPTAISAAATGFCFNVGRLFTGLAVFFVGDLVNLMGGYGNTIFVFSFIFLIGLLATWYAGVKTHYATH
jgi:MFS family permease